MFPIRKHEKKQLQEGKTLDSIEKSSYEVVRFKEPFRFLSPDQSLVRQIVLFVHRTHKASYLTKDSAPSLLRKVPDTFCFTFVIRISRSA